MPAQPQLQDPPISAYVDAILWAVYMLFILASIAGAWVLHDARYQIGCIANMIGATALVVAFKRR